VKVKRKLVQVLAIHHSPLLNRISRATLFSYLRDSELVLLEFCQLLKMHLFAEDRGA